MGSKNRISKDIMSIMLKERVEGQYWVEPFVGGGNMIDKVDGNRIGSDINKYVIQALVAIRDHVEELPKNNMEFTEYDYRSLRLNDEYRFKCYAGFSFSYGGKWLGGWRRDKTGKRDYVNESYRNAVKQSQKLLGVNLVISDYIDLKLPKCCIIYCDPPYKNTTKYPVNFDHETFFNWCRMKSGEGHTVFVSEYAAPADFKCIWEKEINSSLTKNTGAKKGVEKLFKI